MATEYRIAKVKYAKKEMFVIVGIDFAGTSPIRQLSAPMSEMEIRKQLEGQGASPQEIDQELEHARMHEV